jgi:23S rRNA (uracil1939-C5)-methyltransferase
MDCRHHPRCPGCPLLPLPLADQLAKKRARLAAALARYPHLPEAPVVRRALRQEGYRHRLKVPVHHGDTVALGLVERSTGRVVHTPDCPVLAEGLRAALPALVKALEGRRSVHSVDLRVSGATGELQLVLACRGGRLPGGKAWARELLRDVPGLVSVAASEADPEGRRVMGRRPRMVAGQPELTERIGATDYVLYPGAFFQADPDNAVQIHELVREGVGDAKRVADLYAGVGAYARMLAPTADRVFAVEEVPQAARAARHGSPAGLEVVSARVEDVVLEERFDAVVVNPARRGCEPQALAAIAGCTDRLVMVSCGPESFARDLDVLAAHGLRVRALHAVDLFPQTAEVEAVAFVERGPALRRFPVKGGHARPPWLGEPSGAIGRPTEVTVLLVGPPPKRLPDGVRLEVLDMVATHTLARLTVRRPLEVVLAELARSGHPLAGADPRTQRFFRQRAGLVRPFVHVSVARGSDGETRAPLHGDLQEVLDTLRAGAPRPSPGRRSGRPGRRPRHRGAGRRRNG